MSAREAALFFTISGWVGFIVLDGAACLLLALTPVVGRPLAQANAARAFTVVPNTVLTILAFAAHGQMDWRMGAVMGAGSVVELAQLSMRYVRSL